MDFSSTIMIVEDSITQSLKLRTVLEAEGYNVIEKSNGYNH